MQGPGQPDQPYGGTPRPQGPHPGYPQQPPGYPSGYASGGPTSGAYGGSSFQQAPPPRASMLPIIATVVSLLGALAAFVYGGYALTARRGVFADLDGDPGSVSSDTASTSDTTNVILLTVALVLVVSAAALWLAVLLRARRRRSIFDWVALGLLGLGTAVALVGAVLTSRVDTVDDAGKAATGYVLVGLGFLLLTLGLMSAALGLREKDPRTGGSGVGGGEPWSGPPPQPALRPYTTGPLGSYAQGPPQQGSYVQGGPAGQNRPYGERPPDRDPYGQDPSGRGPYGQGSPGEGPYGQDRSGQGSAPPPQGPGPSGPPETDRS